MICTNFAVGKRHDFRLFKESNLKISNKTKVLADTGFQGIKEIHENSEIPKKKSKKQKLTLSDKLENRRISSLRVKIENIIGFIKRFKIVSDRYRCRRRRFSLRFNLISGVCNFDLIL